MGIVLAVTIGVLIAVTLVAALLISFRRRHRPNTPAARYLRDVRGIQLDTYQQIKPRYSRQVGDPGGYVGGTGPPVG